MKVIFVNRFFYPDHSATSQMLSGVALGLAGAGYDVRIVTSRLRYDDHDCRLPAFETDRGVSVTRVWTTRFGRSNLPGRALDYLSFYFTAALAIWRLARAGDVVVAKTDPPMLSVVAAPITRWRGAQLVNWLQDIFPEVSVELGMARGWASRVLLGLLRRLRDRSLRHAAVNVVLGERMVAHVAGLGVPAERIRIIANWADGALIRPIDAGASALRREWDLTGKFVVGYSGNFGRAHDAATMLEAIEVTERTHRPGPDGAGPDAARGLQRQIVWLFVGGGAQLEVMRAEVAGRHLASVMFKPYQPSERLADSLSVADVHLITLRPQLEGLIVPSKFYGVAAAGRPSIFIGDADGEIARILTSTNTGKVVTEGDGAGLARVVQDLAAAPELVAEIGARARQVFDARYDLTRAVEAWKHTIDEAGRAR